MPKTSSADMAAIAALQLINALKHPSPATTLRALHPSAISALTDLAKIFNQAIIANTNNVQSDNKVLVAPPTIPENPSIAPLRVVQSPSPPRVGAKEGANPTELHVISQDDEASTVEDARNAAPPFSITTLSHTLPNPSKSNPLRCPCH